MTDIFQKNAVNILYKILKDAGLEYVKKSDIEYFVQQIIHASTTQTNDIMFGAKDISFEKDTDNVE